VPEPASRPLGLLRCQPSPRGPAPTHPSTVYPLTPPLSHARWWDPNPSSLPPHAGACSTRSPAISSSAGGSQLFVYHADAIDTIRKTTLTNWWVGALARVVYTPPPLYLTPANGCAAHKRTRAHTQKLRRRPFAQRPCCLHACPRFNP
jgi:hypothetical protein